MISWLLTELQKEQEKKEADIKELARQVQTILEDGPKYAARIKALHQAKTLSQEVYQAYLDWIKISEKVRQNFISVVDQNPDIIKEAARRAGMSIEDFRNQIAQESIAPYKIVGFVEAKPPATTTDQSTPWSDDADYEQYSQDIQEAEDAFSLEGFGFVVTGTMLLCAVVIALGIAKVVTVHLENMGKQKVTSKGLTSMLDKIEKMPPGPAREALAKQYGATLRELSKPAEGITEKFTKIATTVGVIGGGALLVWLLLPMLKETRRREPVRSAA